MRRSILMFAIIALITSCKSSASVAPIILKDSVSITYKPAVPPTTIRVDTVFIERWHTQTVPTPPPRGESVGATKFYKDCTKGFWILLIVFLGSFGFRILKAIYLKR